MIVTIGLIARAHGVNGEVVIDLRTDTPEERFASGSVVDTEPGGRSLTIDQARPHSGRFLVRFTEVNDRDAAEELRGVHLVTEIPDDAETGEPDAYYPFQLAGLAVELSTGQKIGAVDDVVHGAAQDQLSVRLDAQEGSTGSRALVPFVSQIVTEVDVPGGRVVIDPPPGLLELGAAEESS